MLLDSGPFTGAPLALHRVTTVLICPLSLYVLPIGLIMFQCGHQGLMSYLITLLLLYKQVILIVGSRKSDLTNWVMTAWVLRLRNTLWKNKIRGNIFPLSLLPRVQAVESSFLPCT